ncbi:BTAD domain-containing putative transcriptional regulator [Streptomyces sp. NPDC048518]|uniref:BTAD domain-containing putative transcriptional regulator n=1 Tax=Streptomyces sp. NPDC048518 TaxID=3155029 RepID=UPI0033C8BADA
MGVLQLRLLGGFRAERGQGVPPVERWARPGARTLVKLLAVTPGHQLHRERVMAVCWPHAELAAAQRNLRVALHAARHALEPELAPRAPSSYLVADGALLRLAPGAVVVDADRAEARAERALAAGAAPELAGAWAEFTGELLPEDRYAAWAEPRRARLADLRDRVGLALATARLAEDRPEEAAAVARHLVEHAPSDERAHRLLMVAYVRQGRYGEAARQYERCARALAEEHGGLPGPETERLRHAAFEGRVLAGAGAVVVPGVVGLVVVPGSADSVLVPGPAGPVAVRGPADSVVVPGSADSVVVPGPVDRVVAPGSADSVMVPGPMDSIVASGSADSVVVPGSAGPAAAPDHAELVAAPRPAGVDAASSPTGADVAPGPIVSGVAPGPAEPAAAPGHAELVAATGPAGAHAAPGPAGSGAAPGPIGSGAASGPIGSGVAPSPAGADAAQGLAEADAARVRCDWARTLERSGRYDDAIRVLREALASYGQQGRADACAMTASRLAEVLARHRTSREAHAVLAAHPPAAQAPAEVRATCRLARAMALFHEGDYEAGLGAAREAQEMVEGAETSPRDAGGQGGLADGGEGHASRAGLLARALAQQATCNGLLGRFDAAEAPARSALVAAERAGDPALLATVLSVLRENARRAGRHERAVALGRQALALAEQQGRPTATAFERANLAELQLLLGDTEEADRLARAAVELAEPFGGTVLAFALTALARVHTATEPRAAEALLARAARCAREGGHRQAVDEVRAARAEWEAARG